MSDYGLPDDNDRLEVFEDAKGEWRWHVQAGNGEIIADSAEGYETPGGARRAAQRVFPPAPLPSMAPVVTPPPAPVQRIGSWPFWLALAMAIGFLVGLLIGLWVSDDDGDDPDPRPVTTTEVTTAPTTTTEVDTPEGTVITNGSSSVLTNDSTTTTEGAMGAATTTSIYNPDRPQPTPSLARTP